MSVSILSETTVDETEQRFVINRLSWERYLTISDALGEIRGVRANFRKGRLTLLTKSRRHEWFNRWLGDLIKAVASGCGIAWEYGGETTYRSRDLGVGLEADDTFYLGPNAERMRGPQNVDLSDQPPPDLAIEIEVSHSADESMAIYAELRVPEVWRFNVPKWSITFCRLQTIGTYKAENRSTFLPLLEVTDILEQIRLAEELGASGWYEQLGGWVRDIILPRLNQPKSST